MFKFVLCLILLSISLLASERCALLKREVRLAHYRAFGTSYPWQYGVAQLEQESGCRPSISNDGVGSQGVAQITYRWWKNVLDQEGISEIASVQGSLRAQAAIMRYLHEPGRPLWVTYQRYNGGDWVLKEIKRAGAEDWAKAKAQCTRGDSHFTLKNGKVQTRNNCDINYEYSQKIYDMGGKYGDVQDNSQFRYW